MDRTSKVGLGPGALVYVGDHKNEDVQINVTDYSIASYETFILKDLEQCKKYSSTESVTWFDICGLNDSAIIEKIGSAFNVHILVLEDIMNSTSRPKVEFFDDYIFITLKMLDFQGSQQSLNTEQFSLLIGKGFLLTFQERLGDNFDPIRERIKTSKGKVRGQDAAYLAYLLLDVIIDNYIKVSQLYFTRIEKLEEVVLKRPNEYTLYQILGLRKELLDFKRSIDPLKEAINSLANESEPENAKYFRDLYDHIIYESDNLNMYREMIVNLLDLHHSTLNMRTNAVMKVLTVITTIFVPLTFIVGVYGMNFDNMPELHWKNGYFYIMGFMTLTVIGMLFYFRKKKWL
jgi:magnesium transporter